ncbi:MAG: ribosome rescue protein RqcH, partial [Candidatus Heimdallarchaeaceae archaeon]
MKTSLSSLDITALVAEISPNIVGSWVNNIYSIGKNLVILRFRKTTETTSEFIFELGKRFHLTKYVRKKPSTPNNKVMSLRKHIRDLPVKNFYQKGLDRVVVFEIAYKDSFYKLVLELFGEGNLILVGPNNKIILAYNYRRMKDRDIHPGKEFVFPPSPTENILTITKESFFNKMGQYEGKIITFLNTVLGLGPQYSKDIMLKTKISAKTVDALEPKDKDLLYLKVEELKEIIESKNFTYYQYMDDGEVVDITPISFARYKDLEEQIVDSFNNALDDFFSSQEEEPDFAEDKTETTGKISKLKKILDDQQSHLQALIKQEALEKKKGDLLYAYFSEVDELLKTMLDARKSGIPWEEILTKLEQGKRQGIKSAQLVERIEPKNKKLTVKLKDEGKEILSFDIDFTKSLVENANLFYEKSKKARRKIPGAEAAIKRTKQLIEETESKKEDIVKIEETKPLVMKRPKKWYEKFHWFICDDKIVIGGMDVKSNERILKTYLDDNDLFFHADVHGSPYV